MRVRVFSKLADTVDFCFQFPSIVVFCRESSSFWSGILSDPTPSGNIYVELRYVICNSEFGSDDFYNEYFAFCDKLQEEIDNA